MTALKVPLPSGLVARRAAGGRKGATRWEVYLSRVDIDRSSPDTIMAAWLGDVVSWQPENVWDWQPVDGNPQVYATAQEAVDAITGPHTCQTGPVCGYWFSPPHPEDPGTCVHGSCMVIIASPGVCTACSGF